ncbi:NUDIX domain-containing protein [Actinocrispum sp. NPDC049592]|uniref:NUDIX domain-containing protein n=1 Tax=Actinocrispum sp. NPDC049592 TaxID=3154835 RepID=UPI003443EB0B
MNWLATGATAWDYGTMPLRVTAYGTDTFDDIRTELVSSVRCIVRVGTQIVLCENRDGAHPLPGGRREPGETYHDTVCREVHEETGWHLDRDSLRPLGWLRLEHLSPQRPKDPHPYPVFLQLIYTGTAHSRTSESWSDIDGYELRSSLTTVEEARRRTSNDLLAHSFLDLVEHSINHC